MTIHAIHEPSGREATSSPAPAADPAWKPTGAALAVGGAIAIVCTGIHAVSVGGVGLDRQAAASATVAAADAALLAAFLVLTYALRSLSAVPGAARNAAGGRLADAARLAALVGGVFAIAHVTIELYGLHQAARVLLTAPSSNGVVDLPVDTGSAAFWATSSVVGISDALAAVSAVVFTGLAPVLVGLTLRTVMTTYPRSLAAFGVLGGAVSVITGVVDLVDSSHAVADLPSLLASLLVLGWIVITGLWAMTVARPAVPSA